jgi:plasmid maintenance system antidote protein VapI
MDKKKTVLILTPDPGAFKTTAEFWMNLQMTYDLRNAEKALPARVRKSIEDNRSALA